VFESDLFKQRTENIKLKKQVKELEDKNIINKQNANNTSSAFSLPSEFKKKWEELMSECLLDAWGNFVADFKLFAFLTQMSFYLCFELIDLKKKCLVQNISEILHFDGKE